MCTAITFQTDGFYFGRTLDYEHTFGEEVTVTPRNFPLAFRHTPAINSHYAMIGMAHIEEGYPLYYDAMNECGLAMAGLNFTESTVYGKPVPGKENVAHFELIPWVLSQCATVSQAATLLDKLNVTDDAFRENLPPARLHWLLADRKEAVVLEQMAGGLGIHSNPVGVLTNEPPFELQMNRLCDYMSLSSGAPLNRFAPGLSLKPYSRGMGAIGLPGDLSSASRFVRAAFVKHNSVCDGGEETSVSQFFHILGAVEQQRGCCRVGEDYEITQYTSCCSADRGIYYYTTYENRGITAVELNRCDLDAAALVRFPLNTGQQISRGEYSGENLRKSENNT